MTIAMGIAWLHFGRRRHVLSWTIAYGLSLLQWLANGASVLLGSRLLLGMATMFVIGSATMVLVGVRQRDDKPLPHVALGGIALLVMLASLHAALAGDRMLIGMISPAYTGVMMLGAALSLWPREQRFSAPELALFLMFSAFALFEMGLVTSAAASSGGTLDLYRTLLALCLPSIYVGTGVAAVLVVAGDLAQQLRLQMSHDPLTTVLNRRGFDEAAGAAIAQARRHGRPLALVVCDLDAFKALNDGHGHIAGDHALRCFAQLLKGAVRRGDIVGRLGGDEFGLLLQENDAHAAAIVMERVRNEVPLLALTSAPGARLRASFGVAELMADDLRLEDLVIRADAALYVAKNQGRDQVSIWRAA